MIKKASIILGGLIGLSCLVLGVSGTFDRIKGGLNNLQGKVAENTSTENLLTQAHRQANTVKTGIRKATDIVNRFGNEAKQTAETVARKTAQRDTHAMHLATVREFFASGKQDFIFNSEKYTQQEVAADTVNMVAAIDKLDLEITAHNKSLKTLNQAVSRARTTLAQGQEDLRKAQTQIKALEIGVVTEQARAEVTKALAAMEGTVNNGEGELSSTLGEIKHRLDKAEEENNAATGQVPGNIVWDGGPAPRTMVDLIDSLIKPSVVQPVVTEPKAAAPTPTPAPSAGGVKLVGI